MDCPQCDKSHPRGSEACPQRRVGTIIAGRYRIARLIGMGGMGAVFEAVHLELGQPVALKVLQNQFARDAETAERFRREAREAAALGHPGIVAVKDLGQEADGTLFLVMEILEGESLAQMMRRGPLPVERAIRIVKEALVAVSVAHAHGIVHRDLKPENLFLTKDDRVKVLDFGLAKVLQGQDVTQSGTVMGTPIYMSPEQLRDAKRVDARADVYSMGATLYALLTGKPPVAGESLSEVLFRLAEGEVQRHPKKERPEIPMWLDATVERSLEAKPENRFASADEMIRALDGKIVKRSRPWWALALLPLIAGGIWAATRPAMPLPSVVPPAQLVEPSPPPGMILIRGGSFLRGSTPEEVDAAYAWCRTLAGDECRKDLYQRELPAAQATVTPYFLDVNETASEVTWAEAKAACEARGARLPTELEWELAARGVERRRFPWGNDEPTCDRVAFGRGGPCKKFSAPHGSGDVTPLGVHDLGGGVAEWVADGFREKWDGPPVAGFHSVRGGYFDGLAESTRAAGRSRLKDGERAVNIGYRCARSL